MTNKPKAECVPNIIHSTCNVTVHNKQAWFSTNHFLWVHDSNIKVNLFIINCEYIAVGDSNWLSFAHKTFMLPDYIEANCKHISCFQSNSVRENNKPGFLGSTKPASESSIKSSRKPAGLDANQIPFVHNNKTKQSKQVATIVLGAKR